MSRTYSFAKHILQSNFARMRLPYKLTFAVTYRCNQKCRICGIWKKEPGDELDIDEIGRFFAVANAFNWVDITGGEVSLRRDIEEIARIAIGRCRGLYLIHFPTNGVLTGRIVEICEKVLSFGAKRFVLSVSLDGPPELHDNLRGMRGSFDRSLDTFIELKKLRRKSFGVYFGTTISKHNVGSFDDMVDSVRERIPTISYNDFHVNIAHESRHYYRNELSLNGAGNAVADLLKHFLKMRGMTKRPDMWLEAAYIKEGVKYLNSGKVPFKCHAMNSSCFIAPDGTVYPCSMFDNPIGNLRECDYDLSFLWNGERAKTVFEAIQRRGCPQCWTPCEAYQSILGNLFSRG